MSDHRNPLSRLLADLPPPLPRIEDYLAHWAARTPDAPAAIEGEFTTTYGELAALTAAWAAWLADEGLGEGDRVAVLVPPSLDFLASFLGASALGVTWVGINPKYTSREIEHVIRDASPVRFIARRRIDGRDYGADLAGLRETLAAAGCEVLWLDRSPLDRTSADPAVVRAASPTNPIAALVYTSGTTGTPKGARITQAGLIRAAQVRLAAWPVQPLRLINNVPVNHIGGLGDLACTAIVGGGAQVFLERFSARGTLEAISRHRVTYWYQAPTMFEMCLSAPEARTLDLSALQAAIWSGGRPSNDLVRRLGEVAPRLGVDYSMSESIGPIAIAPLWDASVEYDGHVGWPDPGRGIRLGTANGETSTRDVDSPGEVQLRDPWLFAGYHGGPEPRADAHTDDGWFRTGDLAVQSADGTLRLVGRSREVFKSGGYSVYPREVELVLEAVPGVIEAVVVEVADPLYGEVGAAFLVVDPALFTMDDLDRRCRQSLANYKIPKSIEILDHLPMLAIGKVDKAALRALVCP